jgi:hypothetical protein
MTCRSRRLDQRSGTPRIGPPAGLRPQLRPLRGGRRPPGVRSLRSLSSPAGERVRTRHHLDGGNRWVAARRHEDSGRSVPVARSDADPGRSRTPTSPAPRYLFHVPLTAGCHRAWQAPPDLCDQAMQHIDSPSEVGHWALSTLGSWGLDVGMGEQDACALDRLARRCTTSRSPTTSSGCERCSPSSADTAGCW